MLMRLLYKQKYYHLKMVHDYPKGVQNRYKDNADKWVQNLRHPHVKTYYEYMLNKQTSNYQVEFKATQKQQNYIQKIKHAYKPGIAMLTNMQNMIKTKRPDDSQMDRDVSDMTFKKFIQEGKQNFTPIHKYVLYCISLVVLEVILYFVFVHNRELPKNDRVKMLNAQNTESYHFEIEQPQLKRIIQRIEVVNTEYLKRLSESKNK